MDVSVSNTFNYFIILIHLITSVAYYKPLAKKNSILFQYKLITQVITSYQVWVALPLTLQRVPDTGVKKLIQPGEVSESLCAQASLPHWERGQKNYEWRD